MKTNRRRNRLQKTVRSKGNVKNHRSMKAGAIFYSTKWYSALEEQNHLIALEKKAGIKLKKVYLNATEANLKKIYESLSDDDIEKLRNHLKNPSTWTDYFVLYGLKNKDAFPYRNGVFSTNLYGERRIFLKNLNFLQTLQCFKNQFKHRWFKESKIANVVRAEEKEWFKQQLSFVQSNQPMIHCMDEIKAFRRYYDDAQHTFESCLSSQETITQDVVSTQPTHHPSESKKGKPTQDVIPTHPTHHSSKSKRPYAVSYEEGDIVAVTSSKDKETKHNTTYMCRIEKMDVNKSDLPILHVALMKDETMKYTFQKSSDEDNADWYCLGPHAKEAKDMFGYPTIGKVHGSHKITKFEFEVPKLKHGDDIILQATGKKKTYTNYSVLEPEAFYTPFMKVVKLENTQLKLKNTHHHVTSPKPIEAIRYNDSPFYQVMDSVLMGEKDTIEITLNPSSQRKKEEDKSESKHPSSQRKTEEDKSRHSSSPRKKEEDKPESRHSSSQRKKEEDKSGHSSTQRSKREDLISFHPPAPGRRG